MSNAIEITGDERLQRLLDNISDDLQKPKQLLEEIGEAMAGSTIDRFDEGKGPDGNDWYLTDETIAHKEKIGRTQKLVREGDLRDSTTFDLDGYNVNVGLTDEKAPHLHFGTEKMKAKPIVGVSDEDIEMIEDIIAGHIEDQLL